MGDEIYYIKRIKLRYFDEEQERHLKLHPLITKLLTRATGVVAYLSYVRVEYKGLVRNEVTE